MRVASKTVKPADKDLVVASTVLGLCDNIGGTI